MVRYDEREIRKSIANIKPDGGLFEVRIIFGKKNYSGYFKDVEVMLKEMRTLDIRENCNVYIVLNTINDSCYSKVQRDKFMFGETNTKDGDIVGYNWFMIDLDPVRTADVSSSDAELKYSQDKANAVYRFMRETGFSNPIVALSGNGVHMLYPIKLANTEENRELVKNAITALAILFNDEHIKIDTVTFNPARVCKLYGTEAQKGANTPERPHRMSRIIREAAPGKVSDRAFLEKLASFYPKETEKKASYNNYNPVAFDLDAWLTKYGLAYKTEPVADGMKYVLECCPFNSNHSGKDAVIFKRNNGAIGFHCFHNSCAGKVWKDVRMLYEPNAYERQYQQTYNGSQYNRNSVEKMKPINLVGHQVVEPTDEPIMITPKYNFEHPMPDMVFIRTGVTMIDSKIRGLAKTQLSIWSGINGSAKSTMLSQIALNMMDDGYKVGFFSGELSRGRFFNWFNLQCAGKNNTIQFGENIFKPNNKIIKKMVEWQEGKIFLYNNDYGNNYDKVREAIIKAVDEHKLDVVMIDNLMALDINSLSAEKFNAQSAFILDLHEIATKKNIHICLVAHPRKSMGFIRREDISGSADLMNAADYIFIVHRINRDFIARTTHDKFGNNIFKEDDEIFQATNCIEICKEREMGNMDIFVPLWYEAESKRLKNDKAENVMYGWEKEDKPRKVINDGFITTDIDF